jgi:hypothetical protein
MVLVFKNINYVLTKWKIYVLSFLFFLRYIYWNQKKNQHGTDEGTQGTKKEHKNAIFCLNFTWALG